MFVTEKNSPWSRGCDLVMPLRPLGLTFGAREESLSLPASGLLSPRASVSAEMATDGGVHEAGKNVVEPLLLSWENIGCWVALAGGRRRVILRHVTGIAGESHQQIEGQCSIMDDHTGVLTPQPTGPICARSAAKGP